MNYYKRLDSRGEFEALVSYSMNPAFRDEDIIKHLEITKDEYETLREQLRQQMDETEPTPEATYDELVAALAELEAAAAGEETV